MLKLASFIYIRFFMSFFILDFSGFVRVGLFLFAVLVLGSLLAIARFSCFRYFQVISVYFSFCYRELFSHCYLLHCYSCFCYLSSYFSSCVSA